MVRRMAGATLISTFGNGLFMTLSALYFTRIVGLSVTQVGVGLTLAGALGVLASVQFGPITDQVGARRLFTILLLADALGTASMSLVTTFWAFLVVAGVTTVCDRGASTARAAMYADILAPETRTAARAFLRAVTNVGIGAGSATAAIALHVDTKAAYVTAILVDASTFVVAAAILRGLPDTRVARPVDGTAPPRRRNPALHDRPYLLVTTLNAVIALQFTILEVGLPLWIVNHTHAPRIMAAATLLLNTVLVVLFQVRAARGVHDVASAGRVLRRGALLLAAAWILIACCAGLPGWAAAVLLLGALAVETAGEVLSSAAGWELSYALADDNHHGAYQGVFTGGWSVASMLGPVIVASTALHFGFGGWVVLAVAFAGCGLAVPPVAAWAAGRRAPAPVG
jgi:MFS family permease